MLECWFTSEGTSALILTGMIYPWSFIHYTLDYFSEENRKNSHDMATVLLWTCHFIVRSLLQLFIPFFITNDINSYHRASFPLSISEGIEGRLASISTETDRYDISLIFYSLYFSDAIDIPAFLISCWTMHHKGHNSTSSEGK